MEIRQTYQIVDEWEDNHQEDSKKWVAVDDLIKEFDKKKQEFRTLYKSSAFVKPSIIVKLLAEIQASYKK